VEQKAFLAALGVLELGDTTSGVLTRMVLLRAVVATKLASHYRMVGKEDEALDLYFESWDLWEVTLGKGSSQCIAARRNAAELLVVMGHDESAAEKILDGLELSTNRRKIHKW
jgi:hypothetical protein